MFGFDNEVLGFDVVRLGGRGAYFLARKLVLRVRRYFILFYGDTDAHYNREGGLGLKVFIISAGLAVRELGGSTDLLNGTFITLELEPPVLSVG